MPQRPTRFTLVELMIVVAIIAVLASIAIPVFAEFQLKTKRAEVLPNVDGLETAYTAYVATHGDNPPAAGDSWSPSETTLGKAARAWTVNQSVVTELAWNPDGDVRGSYRVGDFGCMGSGQVLQGIIDADGDGTLFQYYGFAAEAPTYMDAWGFTGNWQHQGGCAPDAGKACSATEWNCY